MTTCECECGGRVHARGMCARCYQRQWVATHRQQYRRSQREWQRLRHSAPDPLRTLCAALDCEPIQLGAYLLSLRRGGSV